jgi:nucleotide-binding universal stress UspA family protein
MAGCGMETVLLGADVSKEFELVARFAAGLPATGVSRALVGHIVEPDADDPTAVAAKVDEMRGRIGAMVGSLRDAGMDVEVRVAVGEPTVELLQMAHEARVDAVVVGTHAKSVADRLTIGSVSEALANSARIPVLLVRYDVLRGDRDPAGIARAMGKLVLVPTDFSASAGRALDSACGLAHADGGIVRLIAVVPDGNRPTPALEDLGTRCKSRGVRTAFVRRAGDPAGEILAEAIAAGATSIVMGTRGRSAVGEALLGSVSMSVVREADCPVVIVP